jgi:glycine/serine hydroxymethyltransferase
MAEPEMAEIGLFMKRVLDNPGDVHELDAVRKEVEIMCRRFPLYTSRWSESD